MQVPKVLRVDRKQIFALAAEEFRLTIQAEKTIQIDDENFVTTIKIGNILSTETYEKITKEFSGALATTKKMSVQNAYHAALNYLENERMVTIDDYNAAHVCKLKRDILFFSSWSMLFEDKIGKLMNSIKAKDAAIRAFLASFDLVFEQIPSAGASPAKKPRQKITPPSKKTSILSGLTQSITDLRDQLLCLLTDPAMDGAAVPNDQDASRNTKAEEISTE